MAAKDETPKNPLLAMTGAVTDEHLAEVEAAIAEKEKELAGLKRLRSLGMALLGKAPQRGGARKPRADRPEPVDPDTKRRQVAAFLKDGPKNGRDIITGCGVQPAKLGGLMACPWFSAGANGYFLTAAGRAAI